jgi:vacuolar iron transporter family protein
VSTAALAALAVTGAASAVLDRALRGPAVVRNVAGGFPAMAVTYGVGSLVGHVAGQSVTGIAGE